MAPRIKGFIGQRGIDHGSPRKSVVNEKAPEMTIIALIEMEEGLTTDHTDHTDKKRTFSVSLL